MKRSILAIILAVIIAITLTACGSTKKDSITANNTKVTEIQPTTESKYFVFNTSNQDEYIQFLNNFDENKFEIIDISAIPVEVGFEYGHYYFCVTYKIKK